MRDLLLIPEWKEVARKAYSVWWGFATLLMLHASDIIYLFFGIDTNPSTWTKLLTFSVIAIIVSRFIPQPEEHKWKRRGIIAGIIVLLTLFSLPAMAQSETHDEAAFALISKWEGKENCAYQDIVGVWTIGYGHTARFKTEPCLQRTDYCISDETAKVLLIDEIEHFRVRLRPAFTDITVRSRLPPYRDAAFTSLAYNVGVRAASGSTAVRRLNQGRIEGACEALTWWNRAGGRVVRGLVRRRAEEREYCLRDGG